jgi:radical SAM protein with 4Fe4S-binding SPASM domain
MPDDDTIIKGWNDLPLACMIELTNACNFSCIMCANRLMDRKRGFMSFKTFKKTLDVCVKDNMQLIKLYTTGESLLHPEFMRFWRLAASYPFKEIMISTNGSMLSEEIMHEIVRSDKLKIQFSFCGWDKRSYEHRYVGGDFNASVEKIKRLAQLIKEAKLPKNTLVINGVVSKRDGAMKKSIDYCKKQLKLNDDQIQLHNPANWTEVISKSIDRRNHGKNFYCHIANTRIGVLYDGRVTACGCLDVNGEIVIGNISRNTISEIRKMRPFQEFTEKLESGRIESLICSRCNSLKERREPVSWHQ